MEIFRWETQLQDKPELLYSQNMREAKFGDGYAQVSGEGINIHNEKWTLSWTNTKSISLEILSFLQMHITKSFLWTNPNGEKLIYRVVKDSIKVSPVSHSVMSISAEFERVHSA